MIDSLIPFQSGLLAQMTGSQIASWAAIFMVVFIILKNKRRGTTSSCSRGGWGKVVAIVIAVFIAFLAVNLIAKYRGLAMHRAQQIQHSNEVSRQIAALEREHTDAVRKFEVAQTAKAAELAQNMSMHQLWEKLHTPRINLDRYENGVTLAVGEGPAKVEVAAPAEGLAAVKVPLPEATSESLAQSIARLERMLERAADVADQVTEAGTLVGKAMIALNEKIDSRSRVAKANADAAVIEQPAVPVTAAADTVAPNAQRTVEIQFDHEKLRKANLSFDQVRTVLGKDGYFRGNSVRFAPNEQRIAVTGPVPGDYESRLAGTLLGTVEASGRVIHTSDVAVITPSPESIELDVSAGKIAPGEAPEWISDPPKRVGNTWREVIVAGEYATKEECYRAADIYLLLATYNHLQQLTGQSTQLTDAWRPDLKFDGAVVMSDGEVLIADGQAYDSRLQNLARYGVGIDFVRHEVARGEHWQQVDRSFGPMMNLYTLVEFTPSVDAELLRRWNEYRRDERLFTVGAGAGSVLGFLGLALGLLKVDTWTKGYYSKRLFLGVPAAIIGVLALLSMFGV